ncbi:hypothetical protein [Burkholderia sp. Ac-20353]|uniref:hypothetical protein n=1 Tax=Burkholderia sp. Ac-20353 TaxID=2703894 RepID=UPI00197CB2E6|nr:hypothetical protein [Burkholderia sp. Ac-20353]MBN3792867.1 hypothetical protein [Burkholderia sp. Ac-20353]
MAWDDEDERELRHVEAMIDELSRVDARECATATTAVLRPAYWRARLEAIGGRLRAGGRAATVAKTLIARLDELERRQPRDGVGRFGKR